MRKECLNLERKKNLPTGDRTAFSVVARCAINHWKHLWSEQKLTLKPVKSSVGTQECQEADGFKSICNNHKMAQRRVCPWR